MGVGLLLLKKVFHLSTSHTHTLANPRLNSSSVSYNIKMTKPNGHRTPFIAQEEAKKSRCHLLKEASPLCFSYKWIFFISKHKPFLWQPCLCSTVCTLWLGGKVFIQLLQGCCWDCLINHLAGITQVGPSPDPGKINGKLPSDFSQCGPMHRSLSAAKDQDESSAPPHSSSRGHPNSW